MREEALILEFEEQRAEVEGMVAAARAAWKALDEQDLQRQKVTWIVLANAVFVIRCGSPNRRSPLLLFASLLARRHKCNFTGFNLQSDALLV
jgi:hypothetical protein